MIKVIASDMDGTLLGDNHNLCAGVFQNICNLVGGKIGKKGKHNSGTAGNSQISHRPVGHAASKEGYLLSCSNSVAVQQGGKLLYPLANFMKG